MWWMTSEKSSCGGQLQSWNRRDLARYLATTVKYAITNWKVDVASVEPFNEPAAGWWTYPKTQEGCNISPQVQAEVIGYLREELNARGLSAVKISASDENTMSQAKATHDYFKTQTVKVNGVRTNVGKLVGKLNVHSYNGLDAWRDNAVRSALRASAGTTRVWCSEFGDPDGGGMALAQTITEDLNFLRPSAWVYWQVIEPYSGWGLVNADYDGAQKQNAADRAKPTWLYTKYYTFAQFTRFLRPGYRILGSNDHNTVAAYSAAQKKLVLVTVNYGNAQSITCDLSKFSKVGTTGTLTVTNTAGPKQLHASSIALTGKQWTYTAEANSVYSIVINGVSL
jgi:galactan endo-1,6-beta-galactosidase